MLFARQRLLLQFLDALGASLSSTDFQKLLFLFTKEYEKTPSYEFVPYRYGSFSFTSYADKRRLAEKGFLKGPEFLELTSSGVQAAGEENNQQQAISRFCNKYGNLRGDALVAEVYKKYPYYAIRSEIIDRVLPNPADTEKVERARPSKQPAGLATIGYEGKSLESYLNQLLRDGVTLLCDVRRNPISRKYGFSKNTLSKACQGVGIRYEHVPELGIESNKRQELNSQADYNILFDEYKRDSLPLQHESLRKILRWITNDGYRVALTCFEALPCQCHRHCVADALRQLGGEGMAPHHL